VLVYAGFCISFPSARTCRHNIVTLLHYIVLITLRYWMVPGTWRFLHVPAYTMCKYRREFVFCFAVHAPADTFWWIHCINYSGILMGARDMKLFSQTRVYYVLVYAGFCNVFCSAHTCRHYIVTLLHYIVLIILRYWVVPRTWKFLHKPAYTMC
jgi:hypothetical protein